MVAERPTERCFISSQLLGGVAGVRNVVGAAITQQGLLLRMLPWPVPRVLRIVQSAPLLPAARPPGAEPGLRFLLTHVCTESLLWGSELAGGASGVRGGRGAGGHGCQCRRPWVLGSFQNVESQYWVVISTSTQGLHEVVSPD